MFSVSRCLVLLMVLATICGCRPPVSDDKSWKENFELGYSSSLGRDYAKAEEHYRAALRLAEQFPQGDVRLAKTLSELGGVYLAENKSDDAQRIFNQALQQYQKLWKPGNNSVDNRDYAVGLSMTALHLANLARDGLHFDEADKLYSKALEVEESALGSDDLKRQIMEGRATLLRLTGRGSEAAQLTSGIAELRAEATLSEEDKSKWIPVKTAGDEAFQAGNLTKAIELYQLAFKIAEAKGNASRQSESLRKLAGVYDMRGEQGECLQLLERAHALLPNSERNQAPEVEILTAEGFAYSHLKRYDKSKAAFTEAIKMSDLPADDRALKRMKRPLDGLTKDYVNTKQFDQAEKYATRSLEITKKFYVNSGFVEDQLVLLAEIEAKQNKVKAAQLHYQEAIDLLETKNEYSPRVMLHALDSYAKFLRQTKQDGLAEGIEMKSKNLRSEFE